jgi:thiol-disulfide isomerase/thioredoxin
MNRTLHKNRYPVIIMMVGLAVLLYFQFVNGSGAGESGDTANAGQPGDRVNIESLIRPGKTNIVDFYSDYCPPCRKISPMLKKLDRQRDDIVVIKLDINRPGVRGIDWNSPLAQQYNLRAIPYFLIYDSAGNLTHRGESAMRQVGRLLQSEGLL